LPDISLTPVEILALYIVPATRGAEGVNVAVVPEYATVPAIEVAPWVSVKDEVVIVAALIGSLKVTDKTLLSAIPVEPVIGLVDNSVGTV
jgi:hypothetical protein